MTRQLTNYDIYNLTTALLENFKEDTVLPVKIGYFLSKNISTLVVYTQEIDRAREVVFKEYGEYNEEEEKYKFKEEDVDTVNEKIKTILDEVKDIEIVTVKLDLFENVNLSIKQMNIISFMIEE